MESYDREFWQLSDQLRLQTAAFSGLSLGDSIWSPAGSDRRSSSQPAKNSNLSGGGPGLIGSGKLAFGAATTSKADRYNSLPIDKAGAYSSSNNIINSAAKKSSSNLSLNKMGSYGYNNNGNSGEVKSYFNKSAGRPASNNSGGKNKQGGGEYGKKKHGGKNESSGADKRFKTLPAAEALPRGEAVGGYIFVCNNDTMDENLRRELFEVGPVQGCRLGTGTRCGRSGQGCPSSSTTTPPTSSTASSRPRASAGPTSTRRRGRTRSAPASRASPRRFAWRRGRSATRWRRTPSAPSCTTTTGPSSGSSSPSPRPSPCSTSSPTRTTPEPIRATRGREGQAK
ncbi:unnamed protein product [Urochloa decumbens]|uniref:DCD domain-containing protein n=1 Tax=Urochloa decumbens TaxID=240449 RepID=A0ABC8ZNW3_9POAL